MPHPRAIALQAGRTVLIASAVPMALFYTTMSKVGFSAAVIVTIAWFYLTILVRIIRGQRVIGATMLGASLMTVRSAVGLMTGSTFLYFVQPIAGTVATAGAFIVTAVLGKPLLERLLHDFVPVPAELSEQLRTTRFFNLSSALWAGMYLVNAALTLWLLSSASLGAFVLFKTAVSPVLTFSTAGATYLLFRWTLRGLGVRLRFARRERVDAMAGGTITTLTIEPPDLDALAS